MILLSTEICEIEGVSYLLPVLSTLILFVPVHVGQNVLFGNAGVLSSRPGGSKEPSLTGRTLAVNGHQPEGDVVNFSKELDLSGVFQRIKDEGELTGTRRTLATTCDDLGNRQ